MRCRQDSNLRGKIPMDFQSIALTTRPRQLNEVVACYLKQLAQHIIFACKHYNTFLYMIRLFMDNNTISRVLVLWCSHEFEPRQNLFATLQQCLFDVYVIAFFSFHIQKKNIFSLFKAYRLSRLRLFTFLIRQK